MRINDFDLYKDLLKEKSGLTLTPDKSYLLDSRLTPVARKHNFANLEAMTMALRGVPSQDLIKDVVEAMTTNETSFFRDSKPFDQFRDIVIPHLLKTRAMTKRVRIWCAAASTGQEPYSLAMVIKENAAKLAGWNFEIVATDIDTAVLETAKKAEYSQFEVQRGLPIQMLMKYFDQKGDRWHLKNDIKSMIQYKPFNLLSPMGGLGKFDIIFCRNVLIYFDRDTKAKTLENMAQLLPDDGFMFLGGAETVLGITDAFKPLDNSRGVYIKPSCTTITAPAASPVASAAPAVPRPAVAPFPATKT
ncbi:MAG: chemotaxis protein CheR [Micavibrio aeruginosavorus]|uniref:protein-glutamate O-methyltransferase n=1 Tax=Micavibrio aeruginosavorus TaxID=349221 RepID=A0A2W5N045_9BACT|nr:MAG: chemotaxis protein CheR [Micavibrio aeruginosavorus]